MKKLRLFISILILIFGVATIYFLSYKWIVIGLILFSTPLLFQTNKKTSIQLSAILFGVFLVIQSLLSPYLSGRQLKTLNPNLDMTWDVKSGIAGINGLQHITTDSKGFRVTKNIDYTKKEPLRIFVIGGSTTEQLLIDDHQTWTHLLQQKIENKINRDVEVINCGVSGTRTVHNYQTLLEISNFKPDMIIFHLGLNDMYYHILSHFNPIISFSFDRTILGKKIKHFFNYLIRLIINNKNSNGIHVIDGDIYDKDRNSLARKIKKKFQPDDVSSNFKFYLNKIINQCKKTNIPCIFVTQPNGYHDGVSENFKMGFWMTPPESKYTVDFKSMIFLSKLYNNYIIEVAQKNGIQCLDLAKQIPPNFDYIYDDCHYNTNGVKKVSELVSHFLLPIIKPLSGGTEN